MSSRYYPLFQKGNPQLRVFLPNFWMKVVKPEEPLPPNYVLFRTSIQMTDRDVRNYLEKIYKIPIVEVKTTIKPGVIRPAYGKKYIVKEDDYKEALVIMPRDQKFEFPDISGKQEAEISAEQMKEMKEYFYKQKKMSYPRTPWWFIK